MTKHDVIKMQTCVLKVNINCSCEGCVQKVRKVLQKIEEVSRVSVDTDHGKVTVTGENLDPSKLIQKLMKSGKHAELWGVQKSVNINMQNQFQTNNKSQKNGGGGKQQMNVAPKNNKSVKFDASDDVDDDCLDGSDDDEDEGYGHGHVKKQLPNKKMIPTMMGKNQGPYGPNAMMMNGAGAVSMMMNGKNGGKKGKKNEDDDIEILPISLKKSGSCKKGGGHEKCNHDGKDKHGILGFFGFGKKSKKDKDGDKKSKNGGKNNSKGAKKANGDQEDEAQFMNRSNKSKNGDGGYHDMDVINHGKSKNNGGGMNLNGGGFMGMGQMGNYPRGQMGSLLPSQGPNSYASGMTNAGYYQEMGQGNTYNQQQYMAMMNQQQRMMMNGNDMYQQYPMMYARPQAPMGYGQLPVAPPPPQADPITHMFSDENTESCSIM